MIFDRKKIAIDAMQKALIIRKKMDIKLWTPICIFDFITKFNIDLRFLSIPSMEGIYSTDPATILINSLRPSGRQKFTCAHELGHFVYKHGTRIDEIKDKIDYAANKEEFIADCFAGFLLMPQLAIQKAFKLRNWNYKNPTPIQMYIISKFLGVGYSTLITHMLNSLMLLSYIKANQLLKMSPKQIKQQLLNKQCSTELIVVDRFWSEIAIDLSVDDLILTGNDILIEGSSIEIIDDSNHKVIKALAPGISKIYNPKTNWASFVRVSRKEYIGLSDYRHLEEID